MRRANLLPKAVVCFALASAKVALAQVPPAPVDHPQVVTTPAPPPSAPPAPPLAATPPPPISAEPASEPPVAPPNAPSPAPAVAPDAESHIAPEGQIGQTGPLKTELEIYGFAMLDMGYNFGRIDPAWFDTMRPTKLPSGVTPGEFGANGNWFAGVRQTRFGVKSATKTPLGTVKTTFEFEMFGVGEQAGQTTFRLRHAYGELGQFGAGQTWSAFMDPDVFPNSLEYWGPNGMVFFRNVQARWMPLQGNLSAVLAIERPGSSQDLGTHQETVALQNVATRFPLPDFTGNVKIKGGWGHVQLAGIIRNIRWDDVTHNSPVNLSGGQVGYGLNVSSNIKIPGQHVIKLQAVAGKAIQNYINDAGADIGVEANPGNVMAPVRGVGIPVLGLVGFVDVHWCDLLTSSAGYSLVVVDNSGGQAPDAFKRGHYALGNLVVHPTKNFLFGAEFQWGERVSNSNGFVFDDYKIQASAKYTFSKTLPL